MTAPALLYSIFLATFLGSIFHFWKGGGGGTLVMNLILAWAGFYLGHMVGASWNIEFLMIGPIYGGFGAAGSVLLLFLGRFLGQLDES
jgi:hypothetical protein